MPVEKDSNIWTLLFTVKMHLIQVLVLAYAGLLVMFWLKINLLQIVPILLVAAVPTLVICNKALETLYSEKPIKEKEE